jgi:hypothetical protein
LVSNLWNVALRSNYLHLQNFSKSLPPNLRKIQKI